MTDDKPAILTAKQVAQVRHKNRQCSSRAVRPEEIDALAMSHEAIRSELTDLKATVAAAPHGDPLPLSDPSIPSWPSRKDADCIPRDELRGAPTTADLCDQNDMHTLRAKLAELEQALVNAAQLIDGWNTVSCKECGESWSEWDRSVRNEITAVLTNGAVNALPSYRDRIAQLEVQLGEEREQTSGACADFTNCLEDKIRIFDVLKALTDKLTAVHADPRYLSVWQMYTIHGCRYVGPMYTAEYEAAVAVVKEWEAAERAKHEQPRRH